MPLTWKQDYVLWSMRNDSLVNLTGDLVFVGYGIVAPELSTGTTTPGMDAKDKIVVMLVNDPGLQDSTIFRGKILTYYGRWTYKIEEARRQGAAGILMVHTAESATYPWTTVLSGWTGPQNRLETPPSSLPGRRVAAAGDGRARSSRPGGKDLARLTAEAARPGLQGGAPGRERQCLGEERHPPHRDRQRARPPPRPGAPCGRSGADRWALRPLRYRCAGERRLDLQRGRRQRVGHRCGDGRGRGVRPKRGHGPDRSLIFIGFAAEESGLIGSQALADHPPVPAPGRGHHPQPRRDEPRTAAPPM